MKYKMVNEYGNAIYEVEGERRKAELERLGFKEIVKKQIKVKNNESTTKKANKGNSKKAVKTSE